METELSKTVRRGLLRLVTEPMPELEKPEDARQRSRSFCADPHCKCNKEEYTV